MENLNKLASEITNREGKKVQISIAQTKEVIAVLGQRWREMKTGEVLREVAAIYERAGLNNNTEGESED